MPPIPTPCVKLCILDESSGLCQGCGRTLVEIAGWGALDDGSRLAIMDELPRRLSRSRAERLARAGRSNPRRSAGRTADVSGAPCPDADAESEPA